MVLKMYNVTLITKMKERIAADFKELQSYICSELEKYDGNGQFQQDTWTRKEGGEGRTNTISNGKIIEKGGVAFSEVFGEVTQEMKKQLGTQGDSFFATGVSIVLHPHSPHVPIKPACTDAMMSPFNVK